MAIIKELNDWISKEIKELIDFPRDEEKAVLKILENVGFNIEVRLEGLLL